MALPDEHIEQAERGQRRFRYMADRVRRSRDAEPEGPAQPEVGREVAHIGFIRPRQVVPDRMPAYCKDSFSPPTKPASFRPPAVRHEAGPLPEARAVEQVHDQPALRPQEPGRIRRELRQRGSVLRAAKEEMTPSNPA